MQKKEKRALAEAKHEREMEEIRQSGLKAQERDRLRRARQRSQKEDAEWLSSEGR